MGGQGRKPIIPLFSPKRYRKRCALALSVSSQAPRQGRVAAPSVCFAAARILLAAAPTAPPCFRHWRRSSPLLPKGEALRLPHYAKRGPDSCPALFEVSAYSALASGAAAGAAAGAAGFAAGAAGFTTGFGGYGSSFRGKRMIFFGHFWAHIPQPLHLS